MIQFYINFLIISVFRYQVCYYLALGQVKTVKPNLKQLQQSIQSLLSPTWPSDEVIFGQNGQNNLEMFMWLPKEQLYVLVYLVTVSHSMMAGYMDKAQKFTETALEQIEKLRAQENKPILSVFQITLLEHIIMCRLIMGNKTAAIKVTVSFVFYLQLNLLIILNYYTYPGNLTGSRCVREFTGQEIVAASLSAIALFARFVRDVN